MLVCKSFHVSPVNQIRVHQTRARVNRSIGGGVYHASENTCIWASTLDLFAFRVDGHNHTRKSH